VERERSTVTVSRCTTTWVCDVSAAMDELAAGIAVRQIVRFDGQA
jgi:hypothetical protein